jgi:hypothetical protein
MKIISFFKRMLKIGGPQIDLVTQDSTYYPSEWIRGELFIAAPDYKQNIKSITVTLKEFWVDILINGRDIAARYHQHGSIVIVTDFVLIPRVKYQFPFELQLPANCRISSEESGWRLGVVISTLGSFVSRADFNINVQLSKVLQQIIEAIEKDTKFIEVPRGRRYLPDTSATRLVFRPPEHLQPELQYFTLDVSLNEEGGVKGNMLFKMSTSSSLGQFKTNHVEDFSREFQIPPTQSSDSKGQVEGRITNILSDTLMQALGSKNH